MIFFMQINKAQFNAHYNQNQIIKDNWGIFNYDILSH